MGRKKQSQSQIKQKFKVDQNQQNQSLEKQSQLQNEPNDQDQSPQQTTKGKRSKKIQKNEKSLKGNKIQLPERQKEDLRNLQNQLNGKKGIQNQQKIADENEEIIQPISIKKVAKKKQNFNKQQQPQVGEIIFQIFSSNFNKKIEDFKGFYNEYLIINKQTTPINVNEQFYRVSGEVKKRIQQACIETLRNDIQQALKWLQNHQDKIRTQINHIQEGVTQSKSILENLKIFSIAQIDNQLSSFKNKREENQQTWNRLENIKQRLNKLYEWDNNQ